MSGVASGHSGPEYGSPGLPKRPKRFCSGSEPACSNRLGSVGNNKRKVFS